MTLVDGEPPARQWRVVALDQVLDTLWHHLGRHTGRPAVLAVDGRSGSGKSTFAARVARAVPSSVVVHTDDIAWWHSFFDWAPLLVEGVLEPARQDRAVRFRPPAWDERDRSGAVEVPPGVELLVVEGVGASQRSLADLLDASVWVQSDMVEARRRGVERDGGTPEADAFWEEWEAEERPFLQTDRPWQRAALVVAGTPDVHHDPVTEVVVAAGPLRG